MGDSPLFAPDFAPTCYWHDTVPARDIARDGLPAIADVLVIGSGYTGLSAALELARAGRATVVIDAEAVGWGCSTRNGGQVGPGIKPDLDELVACHGETRARAILARRDAARSSGSAISSWQRGSIAASESAVDFTPPTVRRPMISWRRSWNSGRQGWKAMTFLVPRERQKSELGTDAYYGGIVHARNAALDPARFHKGLLDRVLAAEAPVVPIARRPGWQATGGPLRS